MANVKKQVSKKTVPKKRKLELKGCPDSENQISKKCMDKSKSENVKRPKLIDGKIKVGSITKKKIKRNLVSLKSYDTKIMEISKKYNIPIETVELSISNVINLVENNPKLKDVLFKDNFPIFLQLNVWKIPKCHPQLVRVELEHSILDTDDEVCLIVPDVKEIKNKEYEQHIEHYKEILKQKEVTGIKRIMTLHQLKSEYDTFELKRGLVDLFNMFLVDGRISGRVAHHLGKIFYKKRKIPVPIKMDPLKIKSSIEAALKKSTFQVHSKGDSFMLQIGHNLMTERELVENVLTAVEKLNTVFPGGIDNLKTINIFTQRGTSLPVYISIADPNTVKVPKITRKKPKLCRDVEGELTTKLNHRVKVKPSGAVIVKKVGEDE
ncbi:hypothetical protein WA026_001277 [Henosepilachna vigintioctopunctata]|uniref:Ribosomal protein L1 n=1 Tax=Henosepilachna vigintioctopunctata TaxID=420089 RepID=A0AAW1UKP3_9CUCU